MSTSKQLKVLGINLNFKRGIHKNPTPRQIAFYASLWSTVIVAAFAYMALIFIFPAWEYKYHWATTFIFALFLCNYLIFLRLLKRYIYRKVKLIYKTIHQKKLAPVMKKDDIDVDSDIIQEVEKEVEFWAEEKEQEVRQYKEWAEYRRRFVGDISHELKTPIFNIQGYIDSVLEGGYQDEKTFLPFLRKAAKNADRLQHIVEDLEAIARLESSEILDIRTFDIRRLTEEVFEDLEMKAAKRKLSLVLKDGASFPFQVSADEDKIRQILMNLVSNSIKYGKEGGYTKIGFYDMDKRVLIEVADNGIGIPEEHLKHLFERFYRVDKSRSRHRGGTGLGLAIVKHILEVHKQTINVRSAEGLGSTFGFTLEKA